MYLEQTTQNATFYCIIYFTYDGNMKKNHILPDLELLLTDGRLLVDPLGDTPRLLPLEAVAEATLRRSMSRDKPVTSD